MGLGIRTQAVKAWRRIQTWRRQRPRRVIHPLHAERVHVGSGAVLLQGWTNVDVLDKPGVDVVLDVRDGLPFAGASYIYAEHFIEHLTFDEGVRFLAECRRALSDAGVLRLSTPNLDWVWMTQYRYPSADPIRDCFALNKGFRGWGHQFLYNAQTLTAALRASGFATVLQASYGESEHAALRGIERHDRSLDSPEMPHVVIVEASGRGRSTEAIAAAAEDYDWAIHY